MFVLVLLLALALFGVAAAADDKMATAQQALRDLKADASLDSTEKDALLKERVHKIMGRFCGNTDEQLKKWAGTSSKPDGSSPYIEKSLILLAQMKLLASEEGAELRAEFMKNATYACLSVDSIPSSTRIAGEQNDGRLTSLWRLSCIVNYRRTKWTGQKVLFDAETEEALDSLDSVMQCPQQVVYLAGKQLDHEYLTRNIERVIASGLIQPEQKDAFLEKLGPYPDKLEPLPTASSSSSSEEPVKKDEL